MTCFFASAFVGVLLGAQVAPSFMTQVCVLVLVLGLYLSAQDKSHRVFVNMLVFACLSSLSINLLMVKHERLKATIPYGDEVVLEGIIGSRTHDAQLRTKVILKKAHWVGQQAQSELSLMLRFSHAASALEFAPGDRVRVRGRVREFHEAKRAGTFDGVLFSRARLLHGRLSVVHPHAFMVVEERAQSAFFAQSRREIKSLLEQRLNPRVANALSAVMLGDKSSFDDEQSALYREVGAGHLLALSGLHISTIAFVLFRLVGMCLVSFYTSRSRVYSSLVALVGVWLFVGLCAFPASAVRAASVCTITLVGYCLGREMSLLNALSLAGLFTLLFAPQCAFDVGFLYSYTALFALILAMPNARSRSRIERVFAAFKLSFSIAASTLPLSAFLFGCYAPGGLVSNALLMPLASCLQVPAIFLGFLGRVFDSVFLLELAGTCVGFLEVAVMCAHDLVGAMVMVRPGNAYATLLLTLASFVLVFVLKKSLRQFLLLTALLALVAAIFASQREAALSIDFLPVGQGDSAVMRLPSGQTFVIDGGGVWDESYDPGESIVVPHLRSFGVGRVDVIVLSHPDPDHILGLLSVVEAFDVEEIWMPGWGEKHRLAKRLLAMAKKRGIKVRLAKELQKVHTFGAVEVEVLAPRPEDGSALYRELSPNDNSLVMRVQYEGHSILFTGDIEEYGEAYLLRDSKERLRSDIVKAPHHGSKTSSSQALIDAVKPEHVIYSTGLDNRFGFPHQEVRTRYQAANVQEWDTARQGEINIKFSKSGISMRSYAH